MKNWPKIESLYSQKKDQQVNFKYQVSLKNI